METRALKIIPSIRALLIKQEQLGFIFLVGMMLIGVALETIGIGLVIPTITLFTQDNIAARYPALAPLLQWLGNPTREHIIVYGLSLVFGIYLVKTIFLSLLAWLQNRFVFGIEERLSHKLFSIYMHQPYVEHLQTNSARLVRNVSAEVSMFTNSVLTPVMQLLTETLILSALFLILVRTEPVGTMLVLLTFGTAGIAFNWAVKNKVAAWGEARQYHDALRQQHLQQGLDGAKDVRLLGRERYFMDVFARHLHESTRVSRMNATISQMPKLWFELLTVGGLLGLVVAMMSHGGEVYEVLPKLAFFAVATFRMVPSVNRILFSSQILRYCSPVLLLLVEEVKKSTRQSIVKPRQTSSFNGSITLENISFTYPNAHKPSVADANLSIPCGASIGISGPSGSGKSTLVDIILGLIEPDSGSILVDGIPMHQDIRWWQDKIGYVPQFIYLTDDTIRNNIAFGIDEEEIDDRALAESLKAACLDEFIATLPDGLDTVIGEHGARLSGGQRQRIGIARALYHDPQVLVLDEATSALDLATEKGVIDSVQALQGKKTVIIVAHRLSTIEHCDAVYRVHDGRIETTAPERPDTASSIKHTFTATAQNGQES